MEPEPVPVGDTYGQLVAVLTTGTGDFMTDASAVLLIAVPIAVLIFGASLLIRFVKWNAK